MKLKIIAIEVSSQKDKRDTKYQTQKQIKEIRLEIRYQIFGIKTKIKGSLSDSNLAN